MSTPYDRAVAFTAALLDLRRHKPFEFALSVTTITVAPDPGPAPPGVPHLKDSGAGLNTLRCGLRVPGGEGTLRTTLYISAGPRSDDKREHQGFPEGTHYLYVHDGDGRKALQIPMHTVVPADESRTPSSPARRARATPPSPTPPASG